MRLGLLRHFPVAEGMPKGWLRADELEAWLKRYDRSPIVPGPSDLGGIAWAACVSSPLTRARATAERLFAGPVVVSELLAEVEFKVLDLGRLRLPVPVWRILMELAWRSGHASQKPYRDALRRRVRTAADRLEAETRDTLVVTHAGLMLHLSAELRRHGFRGPRLRGIAAHARVYVYQRGSSGAGGEPIGGAARF